MKEQSSSISLEISLGALIVLSFVSAVHLCIESTRLMSNAILLTVCMVGAVTAYLKNWRAGLLAAGIPAALLLLIIGITGKKLQLMAFPFFIIWFPLMLGVSCSLRTAVRGLKMERDHYRSSYENASMVDAESQLKSMHAYQNDAALYMHIAGRHKLPLTLIALKMKNMPTLRQSIQKDVFSDMMSEISLALRTNLRMEDIVFCIDPMEGIWCMLMFMPAEHADFVITRLRTRLEKEIKQAQWQFGAAQALTQTDESPQALLDRALHGVY